MQLASVTPPSVNVIASPAAEVLRIHGDDFQSLGATNVVAVDPQTVSMQFADRATRDFAARVMRDEVRGVHLLLAAPKSLEGGGIPVGQSPEALAARLDDARLSGVEHVTVKDGSFVFQLSPYERVGSAGPVDLGGKGGTSVVIPIVQRPPSSVRLPELVRETLGELPVTFVAPVKD
jgi:hypothetical protein